MAKRFTDTEKWKNPWFRELPNAYRWLWLYLLDNCDAAGIWRVDFATASFFIGTKVTEKEASEYFDGKFAILDHDKWFFPSFIRFQYKKLNPECKPHRSVLEILASHSIDFDTLSLPLEYPSGTLQDKDKDKDKEKDQDKDQDQDRLPEEAYEAVYQEYPRKEGKASGLKKLKAQAKNFVQLERIQDAVRKYRAHCQQKGTEAQYILHFSTFMNRDVWTDWLDPQTGKNESFKVSNKEIGPKPIKYPDYVPEYKEFPEISNDTQNLIENMKSKLGISKP